MFRRRITTTATLGLFLIAAIMIVSAPASSVFGQNLPSLIPQVDPNTRIFTNLVDGIRVQVPEGWVINDVDNLEIVMAELDVGYTILAYLCPEAESTTMIGGIKSCDQAQRVVYIFREGTISQKPEFDILGENRTQMTLDDYNAYRIQDLINQDYTDVRIVATDNNRTVNVLDNTTMTPIETVPASLTKLIYNKGGELIAGDVFNETFNLQVLIDLTGGGYPTGFRVAYEQPMTSTTTTTPAPTQEVRVQLPSPQIQEIFDSFEVISKKTVTAATSATTGGANATTGITGTTTGTGATGGEGGGATGVSIVPGSSSLTTDAYQPNPIQVSVGTTVIWTNDDSQPHTATSGENVSPDGIFDSGIMAPGDTFEHTFTEAGEYPYFCLLHPNQVGIVVVAGESNSQSTAVGNTTATATRSDDDDSEAALNAITEPFRDLFGSGDQTAGGSSSSSDSGASRGSSTSSSSSSPSSSGGSRCPDGFHRSPSGDCERVTDTRGMPRCPDGYHRSPSGNCEYVG